MTRKGQAITLSLPNTEKVKLEKLAAELGMTWGEKPSISRFLKEIAQNKLKVSLNNDWTSDRINALNLARNLLTDRGFIEEALVIGRLLYDRSEVQSIGLRQELKTFIDHPSLPNRMQIDRYCKQRQPFQITYQDPSDRQWIFSVDYAQISDYEDREYLECWCVETEGNKSIPELHHNWCLRLDRILNESLITPTKGLWRHGLDTIEVEIHFFNQLAFAYQTKSNADIVNEWLPENNYRRVVRKVSNTFWLCRDLRRYGADCILQSPPHLREEFQGELIKMLETYNTK